MLEPRARPDRPTGVGVDVIDTALIPRARDRGGFEVRRARDVRPHPHIGLATVSRLLRGRMHQRDSLGNGAWIEPGAVNGMVAGHGIARPERTDVATQTDPMPFFGIQSRIPLPEYHQDRPAAFQHAAKSRLPLLEGEGKRLRLILGEACGERAPVDKASRRFYLDAVLKPGARLPLPEDHEDRGAHVVSGSVCLAGDTFGAGRMMALRPATGCR